MLERKSINPRLSTETFQAAPQSVEELREIPRELGALNRAVDDLENAIHTLKDRLSPVIAHIEPAGNPPSIPPGQPPISTAIGQSIRISLNRISDLTNEVIALQHHSGV